MPIEAVLVILALFEGALKMQDVKMQDVKMQDMKMQDVKMTDQVARHENAGVKLL